MLNILIADDNIYYARALMNIINGESNSNIKVSHISIDGQETINIIKNYPIDIILLDLNMPIYNGMQILKEIEERKIKKYEQSIIVISGENDMICQLRNSEYIYHVLNKVCNISKIIDTINKLIESKRKNEEESNIKRRIIKQLQYLNYNLSHKGIKYFVDAIYMVYTSGEYETFNLKKDIYPNISRKYNESIHTIKSDISKANDYMYKFCEKEKIKKYFKLFDSSKPTVKML